MNIKREPHEEHKKAARNANPVSLTGGSIESFIGDYGDLIANGCPNPDGQGKFDYIVALSADEIVELLLKLNPDTIAPAVERVLRVLRPQDETMRRHCDLGTKIPEIVQQLFFGLFNASENK